MTGTNSTEPSDPIDAAAGRTTGVRPPTGPTTARRVSSVLAALEGLVLLGFVAFYVYELVSGASDDVSRAVTSGALILIFGIGLLALARGWVRGADWPRTPTILWNALLLPVAWSLRDSGQGSLSLLVGAFAAASIIAAVAVPGRHDPAEDAGTGIS